MNDVKDKAEKTKSKDHNAHNETKDEQNVTSKQNTENSEEFEELDATNVQVENDDALLTALAEEGVIEEVDFEDDKDDEIALADTSQNTSLVRVATRDFVAARGENPANFSIKFASANKPLTGTINLCCIVLKWKDNKGTDPGQMASAAREAAKVYADLSNGVLNIKYAVKVVRVDFNHAQKNLNKAEAAAIRVANAQNKGPKYDGYAIAHNNVRDYSNAGNIYAHLAVPRSMKHELGHIIGNLAGSRNQCLGHAGVVNEGAYEDNLSFMGKFPSNKITSSQMYHLGWIGNKKDVAQYNEGDSATEYKVQQLFAKESAAGAVRAVKIERENGAPLFFSYITKFEKASKKNKSAFALHAAYGGGSRRVGTVFSTEREYQGIKVEILNRDAEEAIVRISSTPKIK